MSPPHGCGGVWDVETSEERAPAKHLVESYGEPLFPESQHGAFTTQPFSSQSFYVKYILASIMSYSSHHKWFLVTTGWMCGWTQHSMEFPLQCVYLSTFGHFACPRACSFSSLSLLSHFKVASGSWHLSDSDWTMHLPSLISPQDKRTFKWGSQHY